MSKFFERRSIRNQLKTYLESKEWVDMTWAEGFSAYEIQEIKPPFIGLILDDLGKDQLEMGSDPTRNKVYTRRLQVNVYMESEDRVSAILDDISDFMDIDVIIIKDNGNNTLGSMVSDTDTIITKELDPSFSDEADLMWLGVATCMYETHYP